MSDELKPCPFCGSPAIKRWAMIHCSVCPAMMQNQYADEAAHIKAWNRRAALFGDVRVPREDAERPMTTHELAEFCIDMAKQKGHTWEELIAALRAGRGHE